MEWPANRAFHHIGAPPDGKLMESSPSWNEAVFLRAGRPAVSDSLASGGRVAVAQVAGLCLSEDPVGKQVQSGSSGDIADVLGLDLWNDHRYQITATIDFYAVLQRNMRATGDKIGDEASLTSALVHTRSLMEFYGPGLKRGHPSAVWWVTALGRDPKDLKAWHRAMANEWSQLKPWLRPINTYLAHLSWERRSLKLPEPPDENEQRWPLLDLTTRTLAVLGHFVGFVEQNTTLGSDVLKAVRHVQQQANDLWDERRQWLASGT